MIKVILFDADGVVINKPRLFSQKFSEEFPVKMEDLLEFFESDFAACITGRADLKKVLGPHVAKWGWKESIGDFLKYWFEAEHFVDKELVKQIQNLRKRKIFCALASNQEKYRAEYITNVMGFKNFFDHLFFSSNLGYAKPQKDFFSEIYRSLPETAKKDILFFDDDDANVIAAKEFGFNAEFYSDFGSFEKTMREKYRLL